MKTICALMLTAALGAVGCQTTSNKPMSADKYAADGPLAEGKADRAPADRAPADPATFNPPVSRVHPDEIGEENAHDQARRLQSDIKTDRSATAKAGR